MIKIRAKEQNGKEQKKQELCVSCPFFQCFVVVIVMCQWWFTWKAHRHERRNQKKNMNLKLYQVKEAFFESKRIFIVHLSCV